MRSKKGRKATKKKIQPATVNRELACLRAMFNHIIKGNIPLRNPISKVGAKTLQENNEHTRVLTHDEQIKYLAKATPMLRDLATLMLETQLGVPLIRLHVILHQFCPQLPQLGRFLRRYLTWRTCPAGRLHLRWVLLLFGDFGLADQLTSRSSRTT